MVISIKTHKILWGRSGGKCAICKNDLILDENNLVDDPSIVGDEAHIIAKSESFTRGDLESLPLEERNNYSNLILLCKVHHKQIDDQPNTYTVEKLRKIKADHEELVKSHTSENDKKRLDDELIYAKYIDEWSKIADIDNWRNLCSWVTSDAPTLPKVWYNNQRDFITWIIGRIWPSRYIDLEDAIFNYKQVLQDFLNVFDKYVSVAKIDDEYFRTEKIYKIKEWDKEKYKRLFEKYDSHVCLVNDLFFELTRAANYICDKVREFIYTGFRFNEGAILIERHSVGYNMKTIRARVEYRADERVKKPYPGLKEFMDIRYTRDYVLDPNDPELPDFDDYVTE